MPKKGIRHPDKEKSTGAYSAAVEVDGWVYVSGIGPIDPKTAQPVRGSIEDETRYVLAQMDRILQAAGCTRHDIVKCTAHLADIEDFDRYNAVYREFFNDVTVLPAARIEPLTGRHDLCLSFTQNGVEPLWAIDWISLDR